MAKVIPIENAELRFRNFAGKESRFNPAGRRNFCVLLDETQAKELHEEGWNIRYLRSRDSEDAPRPYIQVTVSYSHVPPKIVLVTPSTKTTLDESSIGLLDWAEIAVVDLMITPYNWEVNGKTGVKAYLKSMYVTLSPEETRMEEKYRNIPDANDYPEDPE